MLSPIFTASETETQAVNAYEHRQQRDRARRENSVAEAHHHMDTVSPAKRSEVMSAVKGKDTGPELVVRKLVYAMGYRYRLHGRKLPGRPDLVFASRRKVIFVHGCFWHRHDDPSCKLSRLPKSRLSFWLPKMERTQCRDQENTDALRTLGWKSLVIWECQLRDTETLARVIRKFLDGGRT